MERIPRGRDMDGQINCAGAGTWMRRAMRVQDPRGAGGETRHGQVDNRQGSEGKGGWYVVPGQYRPQIVYRSARRYAYAGPQEGRG